MKIQPRFRRTYRQVQKQSQQQGPFFGKEGGASDAFFKSGTQSKEPEEEQEKSYSKNEEEEAQTKGLSKEEEEETTQAKDGEEEEAQPKMDAKCAACAGEKSHEETEEKGTVLAKGDKKPKSAKYQKCNETQQGVVNSSLSSARTMAGRAMASSAAAYMLGGMEDMTGSGKVSSVKNFERWFGTYKQNRARYVQRSFMKVAKAAGKSIRFRCNCKKDIYAYVHSGGALKIHLCKEFWNKSKMSGFDSKPGVIVHELAHEVTGGKITDHAYSPSKAEALAKKNPWKAIKNADNYEYFAETT